MEGNARYVSGQLTERDFSAGRVARTQGQKPFAAILGCADSRVAPELAFDQGPGELFVVRVAGNFVTPDGLGSLEYGAAVLGTKVIMVLGHTSCGAIGATIGALQNGNTLPGHIAGLVTAMKPGIEAVVKTNPIWSSVPLWQTCRPTCGGYRPRSQFLETWLPPVSFASLVRTMTWPLARWSWSSGWLHCQYPTLIGTNGLFVECRYRCLFQGHIPG